MAGHRGLGSKRRGHRRRQRVDRRFGQDRGRAWSNGDLRAAARLRQRLPRRVGGSARNVHRDGRRRRDLSAGGADPVRRRTRGGRRPRRRFALRRSHPQGRYALDEPLDRQPDPDRAARTCSFAFASPTHIAACERCAARLSGARPALHRHGVRVRDGLQGVSSRPVGERLADRLLPSHRRVEADARSGDAVAHRSTVLYSPSWLYFLPGAYLLLSAWRA